MSLTPGTQINLLKKEAVDQIQQDLEATVETHRNQAELAAIAAGATLYDSTASGLSGTSDGDVFLVQTNPGVQVYRNDSGSATALGWLGEVVFDDVPALLADTGSYPAGTIIRTRREGFSYEVAASGATDHLLTTGGGVKLYVQPTPMGLDIRQLGAVPNADVTVIDNDITAIMQAAIDSPYPVWVPAGYWYQAGTVQFSKHKVVKLADGLIEPHRESDNQNIHAWEVEPGHARIYTDQNINFYEIRGHGVHFYGGTFDTSQVSGHTGAVWMWDLRGDRIHVWGGGCENFRVYGNEAELGSAPGIGTTAVQVQYEGSDGPWSYITHCRWQGRVMHVRRGVYVTPETPGQSQWGNNLEIDIGADNTQQAVVLYTCNGSTVKVRHQCRHNLHDDEKDLSMVEIHSTGNWLDIYTVDVDGSYNASKGGWKPAHSLLLNGSGNKLWPVRPQKMAPESTASPIFEQNITGATGFIPRKMGDVYDSGKSLIISDLHNNIAGLGRYAETFTVNAYSGAGVTPETLEQDSATAGVAPSSNIELIRADQILKDGDFLAPPVFRWNSAGVADKDYVEIHADGFRTRGEKFYFTYASSRVSFEKIQVVGLNFGGVVFNHVKEGPLPVGMYYDPTVTVEIKTIETDIDRLIVRFIGCTNADETITFHDIAFLEEGVHREGGLFQRKYTSDSRWGSLQFEQGDLQMKSEAWDGGTLIRMGDYRLWVDSAGRLRIKDGDPTSDTDGTIVGTQS